MNSVIPLFLIPVLFLIDIFSTFIFMSKIRRHFPERDYKQLEVNPIPRFFWKHFGLPLGTFLAMLVVFPIILFVSILASRNWFAFGIIIGIYVIVFRMHIHAYAMLRKAIKEKKQQQI